MRDMTKFKHKSMINSNDSSPRIFVMKTILCIFIIVIILPSYSFSDGTPWCWDFTLEDYNNGEIPYSDAEALSEYTAGQLELLRNLILARNGNSFSDPILSDFINKIDWYKSDPNFNVDNLSDVDLSKIQKLQVLENSIYKKYQNDELKKHIQKMNELGIVFPDNIGVLAVSNVDIDLDGNKEYIVGYNNWCHIGLNGPFDPGLFFDVKVFKVIDNKYNGMEINFNFTDFEIEKFTEKIPEKFILERNDYFVFTDLNKNTIPELIVENVSLPSGVAISIYESTGKYISNIFDGFTNGKFEFKDIDLDNKVDIICHDFDLHHAARLYVSDLKVYELVKGRFEFSVIKSIIINKKKGYEQSKILLKKDLNNEVDFHAFWSPIYHFAGAWNQGDQDSKMKIQEIIDYFYKKYPNLSKYYPTKDKLYEAFNSKNKRLEVQF